MFPVAGTPQANSAAVAGRYYNPQLEPALLVPPMTREYGTGLTDANLVFTYANTQNAPWSQQDTIVQGVQAVPRPYHPLMGVTSCASGDVGGPVGSSVDFSALRWVAEYMATDPRAAPTIASQSPVNSAGYRSMQGLQLGNLNLVGPAAYMRGNDQAMIPLVAQRGYGIHTAPDATGYYAPGVFSKASAMCPQ